MTQHDTTSEMANSASNDGLCLTSDSALHSAFPESWPITTQQWYHHVEFDYEYLIIDTDIKRPGGSFQRQVNRRLIIESNLNSIDSNILPYLKSGGTVIVLATPGERIDLEEDEYTNYAWQDSLQSVRIANKDDVLSITPETADAAIRDYLKFVDVTSFTTIPADKQLEGDTLAVSRDDSLPVAVKVNTYMDRAGYPREFEGDLIFLPRPKYISGAADEITKALLRIAETHRSQTRPETETTLFEFAESDSGVPEHVNLDDQLVEEYLGPLEREEYYEAARKAGLVLEERVNELAPDEITDGAEGSGLMSEAFSPDKGRIRFAEDGGEQTGMMHLAMGLMQTFRNPFSHRTPEPDRGKFLDDIDEQDAKAAIRTSDFLLRQLSQAEIQDE